MRKVEVSSIHVQGLTLKHSYICDLIKFFIHIYEKVLYEGIESINISQFDRSNAVLTVGIRHCINEAFLGHTDAGMRKLYI